MAIGAKAMRQPSTMDHHHVRNLWPSVGGGLPGGKPIEPALGDYPPLLQKPPDYYYQSTSYAPNKAASIANVNYNNSNYYYKSSQVRPSQTHVAAPPTIAALHGNNSYLRPNPYQSIPTAGNHYWPTAETATKQFYHQDPTIMYNQVTHAAVRLVVYIILTSMPISRGCLSTSFLGGIYTDQRRTSPQLLCPPKRQRRPNRTPSAR